eukprot:m.161746 g.161746  ORF g.161746 m.161746 type:complete len:67 (+) comp31252_c0_seq3:1570-1770(+)
MAPDMTSITIMAVDLRVFALVVASIGGWTPFWDVKNSIIMGQGSQSVAATLVMSVWKGFELMESQP